MRSLLCAALLAAVACGGDGEPGELLSGELMGRLGGESMPIRYGLLFDWNGDWGARLNFVDGPINCNGAYTDAPPYPQFHAWMELDIDPESDQDRDGPHTLMQNDPRVVLEFDAGQLHFDHVDPGSASGTLSWGGPHPDHDAIFSLEGTFEVERCNREYPGD